MEKVKEHVIRILKSHNENGISSVFMTPALLFTLVKICLEKDISLEEVEKELLSELNNLEQIKYSKIIRAEHEYDFDSQEVILSKTAKILDMKDPIK